ncbi:MAG TPA: Gldg family protein, partial [Gemmataceae bacterium]|nr:Gldg family protein [Gemmataceae bacterium]
LPKRSAVLYSEVENLMGNIRAVNRRIEIEYVPPDSRRERVVELMRKYSLTESVGLLIVLTKEGHEEHEFVSGDELGSADRSSPDKFSFKGENAVITKVRILTEGKSRATVYFAQGTGWLDLNDTSAAAPDRGLGVLRQRLERASFVVKELRLDDPSQERIPEDAAIVVLPRPSIPLSQRSLKALDSYMNSQSKDMKKGKLLVLLDVVTNRDGTFLQTGLEKFVEGFGVKVNDNRVLILPNNLTRFPLQIFATLNPNNRTTLADAFANEPPFLFTETRSLDVIPSNPNNPLSQYSAEDLFQAPDRITLLEPAPLHPDPTGYMEDLLKDVEKDESRRQTVKALLSQKPPALAVTVTEPKEPDLSGDPHARLRTKQEPRLVVFGDSSWVANQAISRENSGFFELFVSTLNWLRERPEIGKMADDKERKFFTPSTTPEGIVRLQWLPGFLICLAIVGLGGGIWIVRRR